MCVGIALFLLLLVLVYSHSVISEFALSEKVGEQYVMLEQGWALLSYLWPLVLLGVLAGVLLTLIFFKWRKVI